MIVKNITSKKGSYFRVSLTEHNMNALVGITANDQIENVSVIFEYENCKIAIYPKQGKRTYMTDGGKKVFLSELDYSLFAKFVVDYSKNGMTSVDHIDFQLDSDEKEQMDLCVVFPMSRSPLPGSILNEKLRKT